MRAGVAIRSHSSDTGSAHGPRLDDSTPCWANGSANTDAAALPLNSPDSLPLLTIWWKLKSACTPVSGAHPTKGCALRHALTEYTPACRWEGPSPKSHSAICCRGRYGLTIILSDSAREKTKATTTHTPAIAAWMVNHNGFSDKVANNFSYRDTGGTDRSMGKAWASQEGVLSCG